MGSAEGPKEGLGESADAPLRESGEGVPTRLKENDQQGQLEKVMLCSGRWREGEVPGSTKSFLLEN